MRLTLLTIGVMVGVTIALPTESLTSLEERVSIARLSTHMVL